MKHRISFLLLLFLFSLPVRAQKVVRLTIDGNINAVSASLIHSGIEKAKKENAACLIIKLNTPGGLLQSTRIIVSDMLASPVPIVVYVAPSGAHAGSAGVFIVLAAQVAAMAPGTNIGAAHPVNLSGQTDSVMNSKATNDAAAFIRSIAEKRKRNLLWAEDAVRSSLSITENEAVSKNVIDLVAIDEQDLLNQINEKTVQVNQTAVTLHTKGAEIESVEMGFTDKILDFISDPNIAYILMLLGIYGLIFELMNPGAILPGVAGVICLVLAFYAMNTLPVNYAGVALITFSILLFLLEIKLVSHGVLAIGGIVSLLMGSLMLFRSDSSLEMVKVSTSIIISVTVLTAIFFLFIIGLGLKAQRLKPVTGIETLNGQEGIVLSELNPFGQVQVNGEVWNAESLSGKIPTGERIQVTAIKGFTLYVRTLA